VDQRQTQQTNKQTNKKPPSVGCVQNTKRTYTLTQTNKQTNKQKNLLALQVEWNVQQGNQPKQKKQILGKHTHKRPKKVQLAWGDKVRCYSGKRRIQKPHKHKRKRDKQKDTNKASVARVVPRVGVPSVCLGGGL